MTVNIPRNEYPRPQFVRENWKHRLNHLSYMRLCLMVL